MRLIDVLVEEGLAPSRTVARALIQQGAVTIWQEPPGHRLIPWEQEAALGLLPRGRWGMWAVPR